jgi:hypothetical protein
METMEQIDHPPGHEIERLNREIEEQYSDDDAERWDPLGSAISSEVTEESEPEHDSLTSPSPPKLTGAEMMQRDPDLTGADVLEI